MTKDISIPSSLMDFMNNLKFSIIYQRAPAAGKLCLLEATNKSSAREAKLEKTPLSIFQVHVQIVVH